MNDLAEKRGYSKLRVEALDRSVWRSGSGTGYGPVVRWTTKRMNEWTQKVNLDQESWLKLQHFLACVCEARGSNFSLHPGCTEIPRDRPQTLQPNARVA
jgi:hypothetical protein